MKSFKYVVTDPLGIHARPAGILVKEVAKYQSAVKVNSGEKSADAKKIMAIMSLGIKTGNEVEVTVEGADEEEAAAAIEQFFKENL